MDELARLRCFVRAAELGSFSAAAREARVPPSSVSRAIAALEGELGAAVFNRSTRTLHLTEVGLAFLDRARRVLAELEEARAVAADLNARPQGLLRLNAPASFGRLHVMPFLPGFAAAWPDIRLDLTLSDAVVDVIASGTDLAIRIGALEESRLIARKLAPHRRILCAAPALLARSHPVTAPADLARLPHLLFALQPYDRWIVIGPAGRQHLIPLAGRFRLNDSEAVLSAALAGLGVALLPGWVAGAAVRAGTLVHLLPDHQAMFTPGERFIWAVYPPKRVVPPKVRAFIDGFAAHLGKPPYWEATDPAHPAWPGLFFP
ncbi:MAG: LysR family transcriptional regulator [Rhodospirillales bacterium]|jgi:DNA-binding transcriptional LysR family regulator|nr:LysR family transcriptional regulator [Rhodospirillales bacterium]